MSINLLSGVVTAHSEYDDIESFFYILLLFFLSYTKPLPKDDLSKAQDAGFTLQATSDWPSHIATLPTRF
jgi:hypothetical protein